MSRNRRKRPQLIKPTNGKYNGSTAVLEHPSTPVLIPLDNEIRPILEANRRTRNNRANRARNGMRAISQAWDDTEALGITADMRRSGPGMLSDQDRKDTLYKAYLNSVWISACVDVISKRITSGGYTIEYCGTNEKPTPEEEQQKEQLQAFVDYTNDDEDFLQLVRTIVADILIYGECYVEIVRQNGIPYSLHKIDCITMNYTLDPHGNIVKYIQNMYHSTEKIIFEPDDVIRFWLPSPNANKIALSPIERIMGSIDADVHMADWVRSFFRKGARPNFWIKFEGARDEANRFVSWLRENYTGMANAHVPLVLYDGATLNEIGKGSVDIDFLKGRELMCKEILAGYQVPPALVGLIESGNIGGGTGESQEKSFLRNACDPLRAMIFGQFNYRIAKKGFNTSSWRISTHYADYRDDTVVSQIQDRRMRNGTLNVNEIRRDMNRPPVDGGDVNVIVMSKELQPLDRIAELADEQRAQSQITSDQNAAKVELTKAQSEEIRAKIANTAQVTQQPQPDKTQSSQDEKAIGALERSINHVIDGNIRIIESIMATKSVSELSDDDQQRITDLMVTILKQDQLLQSMKTYYDTETKEDKMQFHTHENAEVIRRNEQESAKGHQTGMMLALMLDNDTARQLAIPDGEPVDNLHITLAYLGDMEDPEDGMLRPHTSPDEIKDGIALIAQDENPISGVIGGLGRFNPAETEETPIIALVDVPGLTDLRTRLVGGIADTGYFVANNHGYTPHITLSYIGKDEPMPIDSVPSLPLAFDTVWLCIGDERIPFKLKQPLPPDDSDHQQKNIDIHKEFALPEDFKRDTPFLDRLPRKQWEANVYPYRRIDAQTTQQETDSQSSKTDVLSERQNSDQSNEPLHTEQTNTERDSSNDDGACSIPEDLRAELDRWEAQALEDVTTRGWHGFCTVIIPEALHTSISEALQACYMPDEVIDVFEQARMGHVFPRKVIEAQETHVSKDTLRQHVYEIFTEVAERGRKSLSEDEA